MKLLNRIKRLFSSKQLKVDEMAIDPTSYNRATLTPEWVAGGSPISLNTTRQLEAAFEHLELTFHREYMCRLHSIDDRLLLITAPRMSGKSHAIKQAKNMLLANHIVFRQDGRCGLPWCHQVIAEYDIYHHLLTLSNEELDQLESDGDIRIPCCKCFKEYFTKPNPLLDYRNIEMTFRLG